MRTVALRKSNKRDYKLSNIWKPIALLNIIGKLIETAAAKRLHDATKTYILFFNSQIETRSNRSTKIIFEFLTEQIYTAWKIKKIIIFLSLDLFSIFDKIFPTRMYQILRTRYIPE